LPGFPSNVALVSILTIDLERFILEAITLTPLKNIVGENGPIAIVSSLVKEKG
jgi:hypothetical protein